MNAEPNPAPTRKARGFTCKWCGQWHGWLRHNQAHEMRCEKRPPISGHPAIFEGDEWFYVESKIGARRLWALFPVKAWAETWVSEMQHPENFTVKQLLVP